MVLIAPSILAADFLHLEREIMAIEGAKADHIHVDVMDGHFVPNLTMGPVIIKSIKKIATLPIDVHLMIDNPSLYIENYVQSGADLLTIHQESSVHLERDLKKIKSLHVKAGVALNPSTPPHTLDYVIDDVDLVLVMSVNPGFGGQNFLPKTLEKIASIKKMLKRADNKSCLISVDGGINDENAKSCIDAGADCLVAGSFIFSAHDYQKAIKDLRS
jgi:ribulose-phosphate 3-epimerase